MSNYLSLNELEARIAAHDVGNPVAPTAGSADTMMAPEQYRPASFSSERDDEPYR